MIGWSRLSAVLWIGDHICFQFMLIILIKETLKQLSGIFFGRFGRVVDVYIPKVVKVDPRRRSSYAFVRYKTDKEASMAVKEGEGLLFRGRRISVSMAKYSWRESFGHSNTKRPMMPAKMSSRREASRFVDGRSFKEVVVNGPLPCQNIDGSYQDNFDEKLPSPAHLQEECKNASGKLDKDCLDIGTKSLVLDVDIPDSDMEWLNRSMVGKIKVGFSCNSVQESLLLHEISVIVCPFNEDNFLLTFPSIDDLRVQMSSHRDLLDNWFESLVSWVEFNEKRKFTSWIRLEEVPLELWHVNFFMALGNSWGSFLNFRECTLNRWNLEAAWIRVKVKSMYDIPSWLKVEVRGTQFTIKVSSEVEPGNFFAGDLPPSESENNSSGNGNDDDHSASSGQEIEVDSSETSNKLNAASKELNLTHGNGKSGVNTTDQVVEDEMAVVRLGPSNSNGFGVSGLKDRGEGLEGDFGSVGLGTNFGPSQDSISHISPTPSDGGWQKRKACKKGNKFFPSTYKRKDKNKGLVYSSVSPRPAFENKENSSQYPEERRSNSDGEAEARADWAVSSQAGLAEETYASNANMSVMLREVKMGLKEWRKDNGASGSNDIKKIEVEIQSLEAVWEENLDNLESLKYGCLILVFSLVTVRIFLSGTVNGLLALS
ncbi:Nucleotide-binding, alpha-beta plait [Corchorus olitorius]|uniref:Nucleotide-binding, alpha-beta plait n=1 Tax=Corchorus olitorius TaxID=93759 RepID=A0A1R3JN37_9ROSI|nr:Nucleotide-binding, alpha-beta plait [Corchorus olitorius]